jgi:hypothetical protein
MNNDEGLGPGARTRQRGDLSEAVKKFSRVVLLSGGIAACGAVLKIGVRQAVTFEGLWPAVGGGLIVLGAVLIIAALASRKDMPTP